MREMEVESSPMKSAFMDLILGPCWPRGSSSQRRRSNAFKRMVLRAKNRRQLKTGYYAGQYKEYKRLKKPPESVETIMARIDAKVSREMEQVLKELDLLEES